jgi:phenylacetate-CoA oxygenase PaaI subunit
MSDPTQQFSPAATEALGRLLVILADNKYQLGLRYAEWCNSAPTLEAAVAAAALTQDELGHARSIYPVLRDFPEPPAEFKEDETERDSFLNMACLERSFETWADFVAANAISDQMLGVVFEAAADSAYAPFKQRAAKILQEEHYHNLYAEGWCAQFKRDETAQAQLQAGVDRLWAETVAWFGPPNDPAIQLLHAEGILDADSETLRARFLERVERLLGGDGLLLPDSSTDWSAWDANRRRLAG